MSAASRDAGGPADPRGRSTSRTAAAVPGGAEGTRARAGRVAPLGAKREHRVIRATMSTAALIIIALGIGLVLAAVLGAAIWGIATALHHAANN